MSRRLGAVLLTGAVLLVACDGGAGVTTTRADTTSTLAATTTLAPTTTVAATTTTGPATTTTTTATATTTTSMPDQGQSGGTGEELLTFNGWGARLDEDRCPTEPVDSYPSGTTQILTDFSYEGMTDGQDVFYQWQFNSQPAFSEVTPWSFGPGGDCLWFNLSDPAGLPDGSYALAIFAGTGPDGRAIGNASTTVGGAVEPAAEGITFEGRVVDLDTGLGIPGALFCVLKVPEGMTADEAIENFFAVRDMDLVLAFTRTDDDGFYTLAGLPRADEYPIVVEAPGYEASAGVLSLSPDDPQSGIVEIDDIALVQR